MRFAFLSSLLAWGLKFLAYSWLAFFSRFCCISTGAEGVAFQRSDPTCAGRVAQAAWLQATPLQRTAKRRTQGCRLPHLCFEALSELAQEEVCCALDSGAVAARHQHAHGNLRKVAGWRLMSNMVAQQICTPLPQDTSVWGTQEAGCACRQRPATSLLAGSPRQLPRLPLSSSSGQPANCTDWAAQQDVTSSCSLRTPSPAHPGTCRCPSRTRRRTAQAGRRCGGQGSGGDRAPGEVNNTPRLVSLSHACPGARAHRPYCTPVASCSPDIVGDAAHHAKVVVNQAAAALCVHRNVAGVGVCTKYTGGGGRHVGGRLVTSSHAAARESGCLPALHSTCMPIALPAYQPACLPCTLSAWPPPRQQPSSPPSPHPAHPPTSVEEPMVQQLLQVRLHRPPRQHLSVHPHTVQLRH